MQIILFANQSPLPLNFEPPSTLFGFGHTTENDHTSLFRPACLDAACLSLDILIVFIYLYNKNSSLFMFVRISQCSKNNHQSKMTLLV